MLNEKMIMTGSNVM